MAADNNSKSTAAIGCRAHSGWAAAIAISGPLDKPQVLLRRRVELCDPSDPHAKQPYHAAEPLEFTQAEELVKRCIASSQILASRAMQSIITHLEKDGHRISGAGVVCASGRSLPDLKAILSSHALIHAAEGEMFREVLVHASQECGLPVSKIKERDLLTEAVSSTSLSEVKLMQHVLTLGKQLGPPWTQDEKFATLAAWVALAASEGTVQRAVARAM